MDITRKPGNHRPVREHFARPASAGEKMGRGYAVEDYCAVRFGGVAATPARATRMQESVRGAYEVATPA